ncbi:uncharacterized protein CTRU02_204521 [Colletotrichum truncatum]|uniref:Uncharacterized protein n=1 Tax=Colletotrichum truncatum TaxID=5467 RepID=A0ACC3ZC95_COLTU|nr:uncharacterized protein CTRU02_02748 [Colletotrichum truncatum]KAF6797706.1 hypothetical protein CTRU02_02748 [Colletotrichum truncatum]
MMPKSQTASSNEDTEEGDPSELHQRDKAAERAVTRVYKSSRRVISNLSALLHLLVVFDIDLDPESLPSSDEAATAAWKDSHKKFKATLMKVYDAADEAVDMALRAENHLATEHHEILMRDVCLIREAVKQALPQDLYDRVVGKGKEPKGKSVGR